MIIKPRGERAYGRVRNLLEYMGGSAEWLRGGTGGGGSWVLKLVSHGCHVADSYSARVKSLEHSALGVFGPREVELLNMPGRYRRAIRRWTGTQIQTDPRWQ